MKQVDNKKKPIDVKKFIGEICKVPLAELIITYVVHWNAEFSTVTNYINKEDLKNIIIELVELDKKGLLPKIKLENETKKDELSNIDKYLLLVYSKATPQAVKAAKKSIKSYVEYLIYKDTKAGLISLETSKEAKEALTNFLAKINSAKNSLTNG